MRKKSIYIYKRETKDEYANEKMIELVKRYLVHIYIHIYIYMYVCIQENQLREFSNVNIQTSAVDVDVETAVETINLPG